MTAMTRIEQALNTALDHAGGDGAPPRLARAMAEAVVPGGARLRPRLCLAVAAACGEDRPALTDAAAAAVELLHCASLVHDDLPCFDDSPLRRGKPSVHAAYGVPLAVLAGDALIVLAFETLGRADAGDRLPPLLGIVGRSVGMPMGIAAGQAWESEPCARLADYRRAKTGALFAGASMAGAAAAGRQPEPWRDIGELLGEAYQVVDDIRDVTARVDDIGKPIGRDETLGRPNAALQLGLDGALGRLEELLEATVAAIPPCPGQAELEGLLRAEATRFLPKELSRRAA